MRIQELERKTGLERPSIRFYEKEGLLNPQRQENGYREYSDEDVALLKKIKLLRQLGISVEKIRALQQGSEDLSSAIARQVSFHSSKIDEHRRCRVVCEAMQADGAAFATLDAERYLKLLREVCIDDYALGRRDFQEPVEKEIHPWLRFFGRALDYGLWGAVISLVYIVILRIRPLPGDFLNALITIFGMALFIPVEAFLISKFGTTPGKFAMGIRLESIQGGNLTYREALRRSCNVYVQGVGCCIPVVEPVMKLIRYCQLTGWVVGRFAGAGRVEGPQDMLWDEETEIIYHDREWKRGLDLGLILALTIGLSFAAALDGIKPKHRGGELTVAQFAENYNTYLSLTQEEIQVYDKLQLDGTWKPVPSNTVVMEFNDSRQDHRLCFDYELEGETLRAVSITHDWNQVFYLMPLNGEPLNAAMSLLLAQENCGIREAMEFIKLYQAHLNLKATSFTYQNLVVEWVITTDLTMSDGVIQSQGDKEETESPTAELYFRITIQE